MAIGLKTLIWNNNLRSIGLLVAYPFILLGMLWAVGAASGVLMQGKGFHSTDPVAIGNHFIFAYWPVVITLVTIWFTIAWFGQTNMIRMISQANPVTRLEEPQLYNILENLCISRGIPMPALEMIESNARNAFASGVNTKTYSITVTRGLVQALQPDEIEAVLGHELTHILNRDVRLLMVTVIFTGMIGFAAQILWSNLRYALWMPRSSNDERRGSPFLFYLAIMAILLIGYMASLLARFALSRRREYLADAGSIELTHNPEAMMRALMRISGQDRIEHVTDDVSLMCIENSKAFLGIFATHPPIEDRIQTISEATRTPIPALDAPARETPPESRNPWL